METEYGYFSEAAEKARQAFVGKALRIAYGVGVIFSFGYLAGARGDQLWSTLDYIAAWFLMPLAFLAVAALFLWTSGAFRRRWPI